MGFLRRVAGFLGLGKDESVEANDELNDDGDVNRVDPNLPRKGFSVSVKVAANRAQVRPLLVPCDSGDGGVQGFRWYARRLKIDEDGDVADEFFDEMSPETLTIKEENDQRPLPRFQVKHTTIMPAKVRNQALSVDGRIQQRIEHQGKLQWV
ncbi:hypothetical protein LguiA_015312 [Lonicera macranthoides]